ncbi:glycosyl hydrolase family 28-related protein [Paraflavitalea speifideaquila]|uniref:glycosyl hydrolase family 28-related protein n=1 Tax=Paraflavitalea speifideaquila TaxID=3076558 RepID=UPI0028E9D06D|nr:glycosyl hydrolase family 28-related protein [Paraflavitalea speifideiaquila]
MVLVGTCRRKAFLIGLLSSVLALQSSNAQQYNIVHSGAVGDGVTDNTIAIQRAIDSCTVTGGKVYFPAGTFLSGTIVLKIM